MKSPSQKIDERIAELEDWRGDMLSSVRQAIKAADPEVIEEWKWMGTPVWYHDGIIACADAYKDKVKVTFNQGAHLPDPSKLFNASLDGNQRRAIDFFENDKIDKRALKTLILAAISLNIAASSKRSASKKSASKPKRTPAKSSKKRPSLRA